jgi:two-component system, LytTR family, sensor kinase
LKYCCVGKKLANKENTILMKKKHYLLFILGSQIIGFLVTLSLSLPLNDFHYFVHELMVCLTFTNIIGIASLLLYGLNMTLSSISKLLKYLILLTGLAIAFFIALKAALNIGAFICGLDNFEVKRWHLSALIVNCTFLIVVAIVAFLILLYQRLEARLEAKICENEKLQRLQIESKLSLLQSKINPHFLFNTLNCMIDVLRRDPKLVEKLILNLSDIYRKTLMMPDTALVPLKDEITLVEEYLEIEKVRMGERLKYTFEVDENLNQFQLPPMILQILVENAIKHGLSPKKEGGEVKIHAKSQEGMVALEVIDSGIGMAQTQSTNGFGLASIRQRLKLLYENAKMEIFQLTTGGTQVRISLPYSI